MLTPKGLISLCLTAWLIKDIEVEAYMSGCNGGYCFVISNFSNISELLDQSSAQQRCRSIGTQLVEIGNQDIQNSLVGFITSAYMQGLNDWNVLTNGKRSSGSSWIRPSGNGIGGLTVYNQSDLSYAYGYLKSTTSGLDLYASRPAYSMGFICSGVTGCSGGVTISGQCYKSFTETLSWYDARNRCLDAGGDLASFEYITTNDGFKALNGSWINPSNSYWIGFRREWWTWQTLNSDIKYSDWVAGHPINDVGRAYSDCLCLSTTDWKWIECGCNQLLPFVCISVTPTTTTTRSTPSLSANKTSSEATLAVASESNGVSTPTISSTATSYFTGNDTGSIGQTMGLTCNAVGVTVGLTVGLCIGIPLIIVIVALAVVITRLKKQLSEAHLSPKAKQTASSKNRIQQPTTGDIGELSVVTEGPYESMQPRIEGATDGCYQSLSLSKKTDNAIISSNT